MTESLQDRKVKFQQYIEQAEAFEEDDDHVAAVKAYRKALPYSLHKQDSDKIQKKIQKLQSLAGYVSGMPAAEERSNKGLIWGLVGSSILLLLIAVAVVVVFKPF
ncbi:MAG: hypothetical protein CVV27_05740 [Candidatus Melainabacteria bacterium HGW-Melainabacteria-1]|nr:MAG: hypothetical protein CVV27_05740 [Candidatus Melainabacteria bacterium HGW-Melainabacteria-1]